MFGIGMPELILILAVALIVIGPKKLPDLARSMGRALGEFKKATGELKSSMGVDEELSDVKSAFDKMNEDVQEIKDTVNINPLKSTKAEPSKEDSTDNEKRETATDDQSDPETVEDPLTNLSNLNQAFDQLNNGAESKDADQNATETPPKDPPVHG